MLGCLDIEDGAEVEDIAGSLGLAEAALAVEALALEVHCLLRLLPALLCRRDP